MEEKNQGLQEEVIVEEELDTTEELDNESYSQPEDDTVTISKSELNKMKRKALAYESIKGQKQETAPINNNNFNAQVPSREEIFLAAQGYTEDDIDQLHAVAKGTGLSLKEAKEHPLFEAYIDKVKADKRAKKASLGASKGSTAKVPVVVTGMTAEDHKKYWKERNGVE